MENPARVRFETRENEAKYNVGILGVNYDNVICNVLPRGKSLNRSSLRNGQIAKSSLPVGLPKRP